MHQETHMQAAQAAPATAVRAIDISEVLSGIGRRKGLVLGLTALFALAGLLFAYTAKPVYTSEAQVLVEYQDTPYLRSLAAQPGAAQRVDERDVKSQVAVLESRDLALKVLHQLNLIGTREFDPLKKGLGPFTRLKIMLGFAADPRRMTPEQRALQVWYKNLTVYDLPRSRVIVVAFTSHNPDTAAKIVNTLSDLYVEQTRDAQLERTSEARNWLKKQIEELRRKVVESEVAVERFRAEAGLHRGMQAKLINQQLSELSTQITNAESERSRAEAQARAIRRMIRTKGTVDNSPAVLRSPLIQRLREQEIALERRLVELSTTYLDNHPRVKAAKRELADLRRQIKREALKIAASLDQQARIAANREAELRNALERLKKRASTASVDEVKLRELEREAKANRALLEAFLARYSDAATREEADSLPSLARVISRGGIPAEPSFPKRGPIVILSTLAGLGLGLGLAFILEVMGAAARLARRQRDAATAPVTSAIRTQPASDVSGPHMPTGQGTQIFPTGHVGSSGGMPPSTAPSPMATVAHTMEPTRPQTAAHASAEGVGRSSEIRNDFGAMKGDAGVPSVGTNEAGSHPSSLQGGYDGSSFAGAAAAVASGETVWSGRPAPQTEENASTIAETRVIDLHGADATGHDPALAPLADWMLGLQRGQGIRRVGVAALGGTSLLSAALATGLGRMLARRGAKVALVDADFDQRRLSSVIYAQRDKGLADVLSGRASFAEVMARDAATQLHVVQAGRTPPSGDFSGMLRAVLEAMEQVYDIVIVHEGEARYPARAASSALPDVRAALVVTERGHEALAESLCAALEKAGVRACRSVAMDTRPTKRTADPMRV